MDGEFDTADLRALLTKNLELAEENQRMLKRMIKMGRIAFWSKVAIWALVLLLPVIFAGQLFSASQALFGYPAPAELKALLHG